MNKHIKSKLLIEILVSTTNKSSLAFLNNMFKNCDLEKSQILIVNQTTPDKILTTLSENIRVLNVFERGLSKSRNLALKNAIGDICLFTDDDVVFDSDFECAIDEAFKKYEDAKLIHFKARDFNGNDYRKYPIESIKYDLKSIKRIMSIEISVKRNAILQKELFFDERFGLGGVFETGEEYLFARSLLNSDLAVYFYNKNIVSHSIVNSGKDLGGDKIVYARAALNYSIHGNLVYFWIGKYLLFLLIKNYISFIQVFPKARLTLKGIKDYKSSQ